MNRIPSLRALAGSVLSVFYGIAAAQSAIPNPLVRPVVQTALPSPVLGNAGAPKVMPVPRGDGADAGNRLAAMPLQELNAKSVLVEELSAYTITAIVGDVAVLRTNVGVVHAATSQATQSAGNNQNGASNRQQVMRVRQGVAVMVGGTTLVPSVTPYSVEFREHGRGAPVYVAHLDSQSPPTPLPTAREAVDPAVATRAAPMPVTASTGNGSSNGGSAGTPQATQR